MTSSEFKDKDMRMYFKIKKIYFTGHFPVYQFLKEKKIAYS